MKKWPILSLIRRMATNDYNFTITANEIDTEGHIIIPDTTILSNDDFRTKLKQKYYSFFYLTGSYIDPEDGEIELAEDIDDAIDQFWETYQTWAKDRKQGFLKELCALRSQYNPIWNVDGTEHEVINRDLDTTNESEKKNTGTQTDAHTGTETIANTGTQTTANTGTQTNAHTGTQSETMDGTETTTDTGTQTDKKTGTDTKANTGTQTTNETGTDTTLHTGTDTTVKSGNETDTKSGSETTSGAVGDNYSNEYATTYDSATPNLTKKTEKADSSTLAFNNRTDTHTYNNVQEQETKNLSDAETKNLQTQRTDLLSEQMTYNSTNQRTDNLESELEYDTTKQRTDNLQDLRTDNLTEQRTDNLSQLRTDNLTDLRTDNLTEKVDGGGTEDEETTRDLVRQGNIGVTSTQSLIRQQIDLTQYDNLIERIVQLFIVENCVK